MATRTRLAGWLGNRLLTLLAALGVPALAVELRVADFQNCQVLQRRPGGAQGRVAVCGVYAGPGIHHVDAKVVAFGTAADVTAWQTVASGLSDSAGSFAGALSVPQGGWYRLAVRALTSGNAVLDADSGSNRWGVGINVLVIGQSNMVGNGDIHDYTPIATHRAGLYSNNGSWKRLADPYDAGGAAGHVDYDSWIGASMVPAFVNSLSGSFPGVPIGIVPAAKGATPLHGTGDTCWVHRHEANHGDPSTLYGNAVAKAASAGGVELVIMHQGETDATNGTSCADYQSDLRTLLAHLREDLAQPELPLFICQLARAFTTNRNRTDSTMQRIRTAQHDADDPPNIYLAASCIDMPVMSHDHYFKEGYDTLGGRLANAVKYHYGLSTYYRGPEILCAAYTDRSRSAIDVSIGHRGGADIWPDAGITGFLVSDNAAPVVVRSALRLNAGAIRLTLATPISGTGIVRYLAGKCPDVSAAVHDNSLLRLPLEPNAGTSITSPPSLPGN